MTEAEIKAMQRRIGVADDGFWGPRSIAACQAHLRKLMPAKNPWPKSDEVSLRRFYGAPGDESNLVALPVDGLGLKFEGKPVKIVRCHKRVADSLHRVLTAISKSPQRYVLGLYEGAFMNRNMRNGTRKSLHAWGAAIDLDAAANDNHVAWPTRANMPLEVMEEFAREGWLSAGAFWGRDAMHFQATQ